MAYTNPSHTRGEGENVEEIEVNPGDVILVGRQIGALRYAGPLYDPMGEPSVDQFIGIELTEPTGGTDGSFGGRRYFVAEPGHGLFVPSSSIDRVLTAWELLKKVKEQHAVVTQILYQLNQCMAQLQQSNERKLYLENELRRYQQQLEHQNISPGDRSDGPVKTPSSAQLKTPTNAKPITPETPAWLATHISLPTPSADQTEIVLKKAITLDVPHRSPPPDASPRSIPSGRGSRDPSPAAPAPLKSPAPSFDRSQQQQRATPPITRLTSTEVEPPTPVRPDPTLGSSSTLFTEETFQSMYQQQQQQPPPPPPPPPQSMSQPHFSAPTQSPQPHYPPPMEYGHPHHRGVTAHQQQQQQTQSPPQQQQYNAGYYDMHSPVPQRSPYGGMPFRQPQQQVQRYPGANGYSPYNPDPHSAFTGGVAHSPQTPYHSGPTPHALPPGTPLYTHQSSQSPPPPSGTSHFHPPSRSPAAPAYHQTTHVVGGHPSRVQQPYREAGPAKSPQPMQQQPMQQQPMQQQQPRAIRMKDPYNQRRAVHPAQFGPERTIILSVDETFPWMDSFGPNRPVAHFENHQNGTVTVRACFHSTSEALQALSRIQSRHVQSYLESEGPLQGRPPQQLQRNATNDSFQIEAPPKNLRDAKRDDESVSLSEPPENSQTDDEPLQSVIWAVDSPVSSVSGGA